jgi:hypothetical protein
MTRCVSETKSGGRFIRITIRRLDFCPMLHTPMKAAFPIGFPDVSADHARPESTQDGVLSEVVGDLLIHISHKAADKYLLREELGSTPIEVESMPFWHCVSWFLEL